MFDNICKLIKVTEEMNEYGVMVKKTTSRNVLCATGSITRSEFFSAGRNGLKPELQITVNAIEYDGESVCELDGCTYSIYRTYRESDYFELYLERKTGV